MSHTAPFMPNVRAAAEGEQLPPDPDPLAAEPDVPPGDDGLAADDPAHGAEEPAPPDDGPDDEPPHPVDPEVDVGGEG
jgi:hypothetical protein